MHNRPAEEKQSSVTPSANFDSQLELLNGFECSILKDIMTDPVIAIDGHSYEREAIQQWFRTRNISPMTGARLASTLVIPNHSLRKAIESFLQRQPALATALQMQQQHRDLMLAIKLCEEDLQARQEKLGTQGESKVVPDGAAVDPTQLSQLELERRQKNNILGRKVINFIDAMALHMGTGNAALSESELRVRAITYASTVVRALGKGAGEYNSLIGDPESYTIPESIMKDFIVPHIRAHGLLAFMEHTDFARIFSVELSHVSAGMQNFAEIRARYPQILSQEQEILITTQDLLTSQVSPRSPQTSTAPTGTRTETRPASPARTTATLFTSTTTTSPVLSAPTSRGNSSSSSSSSSSSNNGRRVRG